MGDEDPPMVDWSEIIAPHLVASPQPVKELLESRTMFNAVFAEPVNERELHDRIDRIIWLLIWIQIKQRNGTPDVKELAASIEQMRKEWQAKIDRITFEASDVQPPYQQQLLAIAADMKKHMPLPPLRGKRGAAAADNDSGWTGWCIREIDALLSPDAIDRAATIRDLLKVVGIVRSRQLIGGIIKDGKT
jgi:hypothetical protein